MDQRKSVFLHISRSVALVFLLLTLNRYLPPRTLFLPFVTAGYYKIWKKKKSSKFNRLQIEEFFLPNISPHPASPKIGPLNVSFVLIYTQDVLTGFYGI